MALAVGDVVGNATSTDSAAGTSRTVNLPTSGVSAGDVMFIALALGEETGTTGDYLTTPTDWTQADTQTVPATGSAPRYYIYYREVPGGGLGSSIDITSSQSAVGHAAVAFAITGADSTLDVTGTASTGTSTTLSCPAVTATNTGGLTLRFGLMDSDDPLSQPSMTSHTAINWAEVDSPSNGATMFCWVQTQGSTSVSAATATIPNDQWAGQTIVVAEGGGQTVTVSLVDKTGAAQASLSSVSWAWFDEDVGSFNAPTDQGSAETTDGSGEMVLDLSGTSLTSGQIGTLVLYDSTGTKIGAYRLPVD